MAQFDIEAARKAGYSDAEIRREILSSGGAAEARNAGYSDQDILKHFGIDSEQMSGVARPAALAASGFTRGLATLAGMPGSIERWGLENLPEFMTRRLDGSGEPANRLFPDIGETVEFTSNLGLTNRPDLQPQNLPEKLLLEAAAGAGMMPGRVPALVAGAFGGTGAAVAHELAPESAIAPFVGGLVGGLGAQSLERLVGPRLAKIAGEREIAREVAGAQKVLDDLPSARAAATAAVDDAVGAGTKIGMPSIVKTMIDDPGVFGKIPGLVELIGPSAPRTWAEGQMIRQHLARVIENPPKGTDVEAARRLFTSLTQDLERAASRAGAKQAFDAAERKVAEVNAKAGEAARTVANPPTYAVPPATPSLWTHGSAQNSLIGGLWGGAMEQMFLQQALGLNLGGSGILAGTLAPSALAIGRNALKHPELLIKPLGASVAGGNALMNAPQ